jgi:uncharacterized membrane protein
VDPRPIISLPKNDARHEERTMAFGPIQIFAFGFPSTDRFEGRIAEELVKLSDAGIIRIIDALAVVADGDEVEILRVSDLDDEQREALGAHIGSLIGLGAAGLEGFIAGAEAGAEMADEGGFGLVEDITEDLIDELPDGSAGVLLIIEHAWAVPFRDAVVDAGGILLANEWIGAQDLVSLGMAMRAADELEDDD